MQLEVNILAVYRQKYVAGTRHVYRNYGLADVINVTSGQVTKTIEEPLRKQFNKTFNNPVIYITPNWMCMKLGWKMSIYNLYSDKVVALKKPTYLNPDNERFFVMCGQKKVEMNVFKTKHFITDFEVTERQISVAANSDMSLICMMGSDTKQIRVFSLIGKHLHTSEDKPTRGTGLKPKRILELDHKVKLAVDEIYAGIKEAVEEGEAGEAVHSRFPMIFSPDTHHLMVIFQGSEQWQAFLWKARRGARYVGAITPRMPVAATHPKFTRAGDCLIFAEDQRIVIVSCENCDRLTELPVAGVITDFATSSVSDKLAVMLQKSVMLINISAEYSTESGNKVSKGDRQDVNEKAAKVIMKRSSAHEYTHQEVVLSRSGDGVLIQEIEDPVLSCNTDRVGTARSRKKQAVQRIATPDGLKVVHFHNAVQIIDTQTNTIVCTPKQNDVIMRQAATGVVKHEIPGLEEGSNPAVLDLLSGDKIVSETDKIKFHVASADLERYKVMTVPSLVTIYTSEGNKLKKLQRITVYMETILTVSNNLIVTSKEANGKQICNVYKQSTGRMLMSHQNQVEFARFSLDESLLFVVDKLLCVQVYEAPAFATPEVVMMTQTDTKLQNYVVKDVVVFPDRNYEILLQYRSEGVGRQLRFFYKFIDCLSREQSPEMSITPAFEDISRYGVYAINSDLAIYNIRFGQQVAQLSLPATVTSAADVGTMQLRVRLSEDNRYVVAVDKSYDTLHVIQLADDMKSSRHLVSCYTHTPNIDLSHGLEIRHFGRTITLRTNQSAIVLLIRDPNNETAAKNVKRSYDNEMAWIWSQFQLVTPEGEMEQDGGKTQLEASVYDRREIMMKAEANEEDVKRVEPFKKKDSSKPSVLVIAGPLLSGFRAKRFTHHLDVQKVSTSLTRTASWVQDATAKLSSIRMRYDCIILHIIADDARRLSVPKVVGYLHEAVTTALERTDAVVLSLPVLKTENTPELTQKTVELNSIIVNSYAHKLKITICDNENLSEDGKVSHKYFRELNTLSSEGLTRISMNLKQAVFEALKDDSYVKAKREQGLL